MSFKKTYLKDGSRCRVMFRIDSELADKAEKAAVVGDFNGWDSTAAPMRKLKDGSFSLSMSLPTGKTYQFRYLLDDNTWINETEADGYAYCAFGNCNNSVLDLLGA
ncbi:MAG: isoamylase early set domain-containing protein [Desulfonatronovibrio sp.]